MIEIGISVLGLVAAVFGVLQGVDWLVKIFKRLRSKPGPTPPFTPPDKPTGIGVSIMTAKSAGRAKRALAKGAARIPTQRAMAAEMVKPHSSLPLWA